MMLIAALIGACRPQTPVCLWAAEAGVDEYRRLQPYDWLKVRVMKINLASLQMHDYGVPNFVPAYRVLFTDKGAPTKAESMCRGSREAICKKGKSTDIPAILEARLSG